MNEDWIGVACFMIVAFAAVGLVVAGISNWLKSLSLSVIIAVTLCSSSFAQHVAEQPHEVGPGVTWQQSSGTTYGSPAYGYASTSPGSTNVIGSFFGAIWRWGMATLGF
jgi:hypothetical protein